MFLSHKGIVGVRLVFAVVFPSSWNVLTEKLPSSPPKTKEKWNFQHFARKVLGTCFIDSTRLMNIDWKKCYVLSTMLRMGDTEVNNT